MSAVVQAAAVTHVLTTPRRRRRGRSRLPAAGAAVLVAWLAAASLASLLSPFGPNDIDLAARLMPPSWTHPLGTDTLGRDVLSRILHGARLTLFSSLTVIALGAVIGTV